MLSEQWEDMRHAKEQAREAKRRFEETRERMENALDSGEINVTLSTQSPEAGKIEGLIHKKQSQLIKTVSMGMHVLMVGGAGTGKTTAARKAAKALGVDFHKFQGHKHAVADDLFGFISAANGEYISGEAFEPVTEGGLLFIDELDVCTPSLVKACNSLTDDSDYVQFPHETVKKHEDFVVVAAANTIGQGANELYTGASGQLDASSLDRLVYIDWPIDENIEEELATAHAPEKGEKWVRFVRQVREAVNDRGILLEITPRASIKGAKMLGAGFSFGDVKSMVLTNRMSDDQKRELRDVFRDPDDDGPFASVDDYQLENRSLPDDHQIGEKLDDHYEACRDLISEAENTADTRGDRHNYGVVAQDVRDDADKDEVVYALWKTMNEEDTAEDVSVQEARQKVDEMPFLVCRATGNNDGKSKGELMEKAGIYIAVG